MKKLYTILIVLGATIASCQKSTLEMSDDPNNVPDGLPTRMSVSLDDANLLTRSGLSLTQEQKINNIFVMVFDKTGVKVSQSYFNTNIADSLQNVQTVSGTNMSVYVVTNLSTQNINSAIVRSYFNNIYTVAELNQMNVYNLASDVNVNRDLVMSGFVTGRTINPTTSPKTPITIPLNFVASRVTLYLIKSLTNPADSYNMTNWTVNNYPTHAYLFQQSADAVVPGTAGDYTNSGTSIAWVDTTVVISGVSTPAQYAFLYTYENRRGTNANTVETQKAANAPVSATAMVLQGYYKTAAQNKITGVTTTVYFGGNNFNDYNVYRGKDYSYYVTVRGINNIGVDSRVEGNDNGYQINIFNTTMDNHPDRRPIQVNSWPGISTLAVYASDGISPCPWLKLSTIDLNQAVSNHRVTYNPAVDMASNLVLTFPAVMPEAMASKMVYLYANENLTSSFRSAVVKVISNGQSITINVTQLGYQSMGPRAGFRSYNTNGTVNPADDYTLVVENLEESTMNLTPGAAPGSESTVSMQWGFNGTIAQPIAAAHVDYYYRNGFQGTMGQVFSSGTGALGSILRAPYGRISAATAGTTSVTIIENDMNPIFNTYPARYCFEKNRDLDGDGQITNPNSVGINEIQWYLPSADELYGTYVGRYAFARPLSTANYYSASEIYGSTSNVNFINYGIGASGAIAKSSTTMNVRCVRKIYPALSSGVKNSPYIESGSRIINNQGFASNILRSAPVARPVPMNSQNSVINNQISPRFQVAQRDCLLRGQLGTSIMTWAQANGWAVTADVSSVGIVSAPPTGCQAYLETGDTSSEGGQGSQAGWRLPTQREMYIILSMRRELSAGVDGFVAMSAANYWTATSLNATTGWYGLRGVSTVGFAGKISLFSARCVRDL